MMTTPYDSSDAAQRLATTVTYAFFRIGIVVSFATNQAVVNIGGTEFAAAYLRSATFVAGDQVYVSYQDGTWVIHDALAGVGPNLLAVANPSFEDSPPGSFPAQWFLADIAGTSAASVREMPSGTQVASVGTTGGGATAYLYSQPIPVVAGQSFTVSAQSGGDYQPTDPHTSDSALVALWFANATNLYPTTSSADTVIVTATDIVQTPPDTTLSGTVVAPVTGFMRLALRTATVGTQQILWDNVIVRMV